MPTHTKIATCSYCGRRQALQLTARGGHELACGSCGAPLHEMKWLKVPKPDRPVKRSPQKRAPHPAPAEGNYPKTPDRRRRKPARRRKALWKRALEEAFDVIEDIFD